MALPVGSASLEWATAAASVARVVLVVGAGCMIAAIATLFWADDIKARHAVASARDSGPDFASFERKLDGLAAAAEVARREAGAARAEADAARLEAAHAREDAERTRQFTAGRVVSAHQEEELVASLKGSKFHLELECAADPESILYAIDIRSRLLYAGLDVAKVAPQPDRTTFGIELIGQSSDDAYKKLKAALEKASLAPDAEEPGPKLTLMIGARIPQPFAPSPPG